MVDFTKLNLDKLSPIYVQIVRFIKMGIISKDILYGDEMPSRRMLSSLLGVNPNTIQKAYRMLEEEGLIVSYVGSKSIVSFDGVQWKEIREELILHETSLYIHSIKGMGMDQVDAMKWIEKLWDREEDTDESLWKGDANE